MSNEAKLGDTPTPEDGRDAVHIAVIPMRAGQHMQCGTPVILNGEMAYPYTGQQEEPIGVIDPFRRNPYVSRGDWFWLCLYPKTTTGLRHVWEHPRFPASAPQAGNLSESMRWLATYVARFCPYYEDANGVNEFLRHVREDRSIFYYGSDCHSFEDVEDADNLFRHLSVITGRSINREYFTGGFHCSC